MPVGSRSFHSRSNLNPPAVFKHTEALTTPSQSQKRSAAAKDALLPLQVQRADGPVPSSDPFLADEPLRRPSKSVAVIPDYPTNSPKSRLIASPLALTPPYALYSLVLDSFLYSSFSIDYFLLFNFLTTLLIILRSRTIICMCQSPSIYDGSSLSL